MWGVRGIRSLHVQTSNILLNLPVINLFHDNVTYFVCLECLGACESWKVRIFGPIDGLHWIR